MFDVLIASSGLSVAFFALALLRLRGDSLVASRLSRLLACLIFLGSGPLVFEFAPGLIQWYVSLIPLVFFLLPPVFWFYHHALTSDRPPERAMKPWQHWLPVPFMLLLSIGLVLTPSEDFSQIFFSEEPLSSPVLSGLAIAFFVAILAWCIMSVAYSVAVVKRTLAARRRVTDLYADKQGRELHWLVGVVVLSLCTWLYSLVVLAFDNRLAIYGIQESGVHLLLASLVWLVSLNGIRQNPLFEPAVLEAELQEEEGDKKPYERSNLSQADLDRIARKLDSAMSESKVHLNPDLTLLSLSEGIGERSQYISQTLSQYLNTTFFDYINEKRIDDARHMLASTDLSVLDVAVASGFNSRSSFYKAFKLFTHQTPSQYRRGVSKRKNEE